ncbi:uncharacterized protein PV09_07263 [Verruconis gallopava]|uniref:Sin3 binding protein n=1 Tax=Verruconis gallopava TaxID=253628 RepID=A0A0D2APX4_9PEZI|nr:uncharacterized protein PV09_07263 [Verruconis gallopava]KIW01219.1 hypothetical protein PV09_07263 [Verruconis gallopava]
MASMSNKPISNIAVAFATQSASVDIPKPRDAGHHGSSNALQTSSNHHGMLPTPPNSISPTLPPHKVRSPSHHAPNQQQVDSDLDLQDAVDHERSTLGHPQALSSAALSGLDSAGAITPTMLARDHLPDFLLANGPMAIRHVLGHLTQTVPGFARIPPAKARRIVVAALESRGGGGVDGDVLFEKVGWGRWDARVRGQPPREGQVPSSGMDSQLAVSPPSSVVGSYAASNAGGLQIPAPQNRVDRRDIYSGTSWTGDSIISSRDEEMDDMNMAEHEADKMSLDGREDDTASSHAAPEDMPISDNPDDVTDEEDWASIGPQALRRGSTARSGARIDYNYLSTSRMRPSIMKAAPNQRRSSSFAHTSRGGISYPGGIVPPKYSSSASRIASSGFKHNTTFNKEDVQTVNAQEQDAIAALLAMGSSM